MTGSAGSRILMLLENSTYPGDPRVRREANALVESGQQVVVIAPAIQGQPWNESIAGVTVYRYPAPPEAQGLIGYLWEYGYSLCATFLISILVFFKNGFDVIHAHNPPDLFVLIAILYKPFGKKFVFDHHDLSPEMYYARFSGNGNRFVFRALLFFEKLTFRFADRVISTNESYKEIALTRGGVPESRVTVVRNGPDLNRLFQVEPFENLGGEGKLVLGFVGTIGYQDGVDYLLRSLHCLIHEQGRKDFFCFIIGLGDAYNYVKSLAIELELQDHVHFTGRVSDEDLLKYLSSADICLDPDPSNSFNDRCTMIKMTEYMAMEKPTVAFDLPEHRVTAQDAAIYAKANEESDFARKIVELMDSPEKRRRLGQIGKERVENQLAWSYQRQHLFDAYSELGFQCNRGEPDSPGGVVNRDVQASLSSH